MIATRIIGAVVLLIGVGFVPAHVLLHGVADIDKWLLLFAAFIVATGGTLLHERAMKAVAGYATALLPAKWRGG